MKLFLDDKRTLDMIYPDANTKEWIIVRDFDEFVRYINKYGLPKFISFDHDLSFEHTKWYFENGGHENPPDPLKAEFTVKTGYDAAVWLVNYCKQHKTELPKWEVHSHNPIGSQNIKNYLTNF